MSDVLLTSAGRRSYLVSYFRNALRGRGRVICTDIKPDTPAMLAADIAYTVPASDHPDYLPRLLEICRRHEVVLHCSLSDIDTFHLSQHLGTLRRHGITSTLPDADWGTISLDKYECTELLRQHDIAVPWTGVSLVGALAAIDAGELSYPVVLKARLGYGSLALHRCQDKEELCWAHALAARRLIEGGAPPGWYVHPGEEVLIQQGISGREYCINLVNDLEGRYASHMVCEIQAMRAGESDEATTVDPALAGGLPMELSRITRHTGIWGIDCLDDAGQWKVIDINPRFTGDYPFNHLAGADVPAALLSWARGEPPLAEWLRTDIGKRGYKDLVPTATVARSPVVTSGATYHS